MPDAPVTKSRTGNLRVINHWTDVKTQLQAGPARDVLLAVGAKIAQEFDAEVQREDVIDTGFYQHSVYVNGLGVSSYPNTWKNGTYFGFNHTKRDWRRRKEPRIPARVAKDMIIVGVAADYAALLEKNRNASLFKALMATKDFYDGSIRIRIDRKDANLV